MHMAQQSLLGQGLLIAEVSRSHSGTPHSVGLLWMSDKPDLTTHNTHKRHTSISPKGFELPIPRSERPHTDALDRAATEISRRKLGLKNNIEQDRGTINKARKCTLASSALRLCPEAICSEKVVEPAAFTKGS